MGTSMVSRNQHFKPPGFALRFLRFFCNPELLEDVEGDLVELFEERSRSSKVKANVRFLVDVLLLLRPGIIKNFEINTQLIHTGMLRNFILIAWRNALKHKGYTFINLFGLVIGLAASITIMLWVEDELAMDSFHEKEARTYQVWRNMYQTSGEIVTTPGIPQPLEFVLEEEYPEIEDVTLISWQMEKVFQIGDNSSYEIGRYVSPEFFQVFSYPILLGDQNSMMSDISNVVISKRTAEKYFGTNWRQKALGQTIRIEDRKDFMVSGVFENVPKRSSLQFDWVIPAEEYISRNDWVPSWYNGGFGIVFSLKDNKDLLQVTERLEQEINKHTNYENDERIMLQKFSETHLYSKIENGQPSGGRIEYVRILIVIAIFLVVIACVNFMSLATARAGRRLKEIGVRKVMGARKVSLGQQFYIEAFMLSGVAVLFSLAVVWLFLPYFNELTGKSLSLNVSNIQVLGTIILLTLITGMMAGSYPALLLPSFKIIQSIKGTLKHSPGAILMRRGLVVFQFSISLLLIIGTLVVNNQMNYVLNKNLGLDKENLLYVSLDGALFEKSKTYKEELLKIPEVKNVTTTTGNPLDYGRSTSGASWDGKNPNDVVEINVLTAGDDLIETLGIELLQGRAFSKEFNDSTSYLINEVAARIMGYENPVGGNLNVWGQKGKIIGVINDFPMASLYEPIEPLIVRYDPANTFVAFIRTQGNTYEALKSIEELTAQINPAHPFRYKFLDEQYEANYKSEMTLNSLTRIFAGISIVISCLGLLGLASYTASQRSKEIGIRKVHGASMLHLIYLLSKEYGRLMIVAFVLAVPIGYYYMNQWLMDFEFRTELNWFLFVIAGIVAFVVGALTVSLRSYQAATVNPVDVLKDE
ncbi:MAG: ABC transporter permease [bacterium]|nr:ABC transporter permease [bacterium]